MLGKAKQQELVVSGPIRKEGRGGRGRERGKEGERKEGCGERERERQGRDRAGEREGEIDRWQMTDRQMRSRPAAGTHFQ